jgi:hypothetical protein
MNLEIGKETEQFHFCEYLFRISGTVCVCVCEVVEYSINANSPRIFFSLQQKNKCTDQARMTLTNNLKKDIFGNMAKKYLFGHSEGVSGKILIAKDA